MNPMLDMTLDAIADLPEFKVYPSGAHRIAIKHIIEKEINKHPAVEIAMAYVHCNELANPADTTPAAGDECSIAFMLDNDIGQGMFKRAITPIYTAVNATSLRDAMTKATGMQCDIVMQRTESKGRNYANLDSLVVA